MLELLLVMALIGCLVLAARPLTHMGQRTRAWQLTLQLQSDIELAQIQGQKSREPIYLSLSPDQQHYHLCTQSGKTVQTRTLPTAFRLSIRGFPLKIQGLLVHEHVNGTITIYHKNQAFFALIFNQGGRLRISDLKKTRDA